MLKNIFLASGFLLLVSCRKDEAPAPVAITADAVLVDEGVNIADGCGWHIIANGIDYIPDALDSAFETDSLLVRVTFTSTDSAGCGFAANLKTHKLMNVQRIELR